jgi:hypothetical protein
LIAAVIINVMPSPAGISWGGDVKRVLIDGWIGKNPPGVLFLGCPFFYAYNSFTVIRTDFVT